MQVRSLLGNMPSIIWWDNQNKDRFLSYCITEDIKAFSWPGTSLNQLTHLRLFIHFRQIVAIRNYHDQRHPWKKLTPLKPFIYFRLVIFLGHFMVRRHSCRGWNLWQPWYILDMSCSLGHLTIHHDHPWKKLTTLKHLIHFRHIMFFGTWLCVSYVKIDLHYQKSRPKVKWFKHESGNRQMDWHYQTHYLPSLWSIKGHLTQSEQHSVK